MNNQQAISQVANKDFNLSLPRSPATTVEWVKGLPFRISRIMGAVHSKKEDLIRVLAGIRGTIALWVGRWR